MSRIQEAQEAQPDIPLGTAEQFLLTLASVSGLEARLRLWAFKVCYVVPSSDIYFSPTGNRGPRRRSPHGNVQS